MIVSLFGMVNTLVLIVFERTRELGMLRAVGMTRRQVRRMVRHESVITALIGAALGTAARARPRRARDDEALGARGSCFSVPGGNSSSSRSSRSSPASSPPFFPARRAARLNVLEALQYE